MYSDPDEGAEALLTMPFGASAALIFDAYYDRAPVGWVPIRYGGLFGWSCDPQTLLILYRSYVRSIPDYGL